MSSDPTLAAVLQQAIQDGTARIRTTIPASVTAYDPVTQTVSARVAVRARYRDRSGSVKSIPGPIITGVPVLFPRSAGGYGMTFPLVVGDWVTLHIAERSVTEWKATGAQDVTAGDLRRFDLSDAFAYPGGAPPCDPVGASGVDASAMVLEGADIRIGSAAASDFVSLASLTDAAINAIRTVLTTWIPVPGDGGLALKTAAIAALSAASTGASKVKAE